MDSVIKMPLERATGKLHYATNGTEHYYGVVYHDPHCEDLKALDRGGGRNYVIARFEKKLPNGMEAELQQTLEKLAIPKTKRGSVGEYKIKMDGSQFTPVLPEGIELIRNPREAPYHPADEAKKSGNDLMKGGNGKNSELPPH